MLGIDVAQWRDIVTTRKVRRPDPAIPKHPLSGDMHGEPPLPRGALLTLDFIRRYQEQRGYPPSCREIMRGTRQRSPSGVVRRLRALEEFGYLARRHNW